MYSVVQMRKNEDIFINRNTVYHLLATDIKTENAALKWIEKHKLTRDEHTYWVKTSELLKMPQEALVV